MSEQENLRQLILDNPELPVVVVISGDEEGGYSPKNVYVNPYGHIGEMAEHDGKIYTDREHFAELDEAVWAKCIIAEFWRD